MKHLNLNECKQDCKVCVLAYIKKHSVKNKDGFQIRCNGIPLKSIPDNVSFAFDAKDEIASAMYDPIKWANLMLDWHCLDPDGAVWKRKTDDGSIGELPRYNEELAKQGKSIFHRPYQATLLSCSARRKVFRCGRQIGKSETLCIIMLYNIFTKENYKVVIIAPFQTQIDLLFSRLEVLIKSNQSLHNSIKRKVKAPNYVLELFNGSRISGFTAGTHSSQGAGSARGQTAHLLIMDEMDYLSSADVDASLAIIANIPDASVVMSSTPTGRRERFYEICNSPLFRELHYPSHINPNFSKELDSLYKEQFTQDAYEHEILATFGGQEEGVYRANLIEQAKANYKYGDFTPNQKWNYMIGVDWNDFKTGTRIAVTGFNPENNVFYLVDKRSITREQWTQLAACEEIKNLNRIWNPDFIYVDTGYGSSQIEILQEYGSRMVKELGVNHPDARLRSIVKGYNFGGTIEVKDLHTGKPIKKPSKPFLVENSVRRFETFSFKFPESDVDLTKQFQGYIVDRVGVTGVPIYKAQNEAVGDHLLDAVNLSLIAFILEKTKFGKVTYTTDIGFGGSFGIGKIQTPILQDALEHKPKNLRSLDINKNNNIITTINNDIPASHTTQSTGMSLWSWPGFGSDSPRPNVMSPADKWRQLSNKQRAKDKRRPQRTKF